jgi:hypothetical protein
MIHLDEKWEQQPGERRSASWEVLFGNEEYHKRCWWSMEWKTIASSPSCRALKEEGLKECRMKLKTTEWWGGLRSAEGNRREPILAVEHQWESEVLIQEEERRKEVEKECVMTFKSTSGNWRAPIPGWRAWKWGYRVRNGIVEHCERRNWLQNEIDEVQSTQRSSNKDWRALILAELRHTGGEGGCEVGSDVWLTVWWLVE